MHTPPPTHKRDRGGGLLSPVEKTMKRLVSGTFTRSSQDLSKIFDSIKRGNKARIYSLIDNTCLVRDCFMQFRDDEKIGSLCFTIHDQNNNESTMSVPLHLISDIWLGKQTSALMDPSISDAVTDLACTILFLIDDRSTEINFSTESTDVLNNWIIAINDVMRRSGRQLCRSDVENTPKSRSKEKDENLILGSGTKRRFSIIAEPSAHTLRETSTEERTRYMSMRLHIRAYVKPALKTVVMTKNRMRPSIAASLSNFGSFLEKTSLEVLNTVRGFTDVSQSLKTALDRERSKSKALLNQLIEVQGNIRVFARVRPLLGFETADTCITVHNQVADREMSLLGGSSGEFDDLASVIAGEEGSVIVNTNDRSNNTFTFDKVFGPESAQSTVAREIVPFVHSCIDGYNVCIMAYGQTGSGKTFTMEGTKEMPGVNYRALDELFSRTSELQRIALETGTGEIQYTVHLSAIEIYNETPRDLLFSGSDPSLNKLDIRVSEKGVTVPGLTTVQVTTVEQVRHILVTKAYRNRAVGCTNMNATSSRSHCAVFITLECLNRTTGAKTNGKLVMVDLAGSERIDKSGAVGQAQEEANNINLSLTCLGNVISALQTKQKDKTKYIPYRDSKLTYLLQDCLSGNSKCLMFCNLSPATSNASESICTLRFASRAREVQLGKAKRNNQPPPPPIPSQSAPIQQTDTAQKDKQISTLRAQVKRAEEDQSRYEARIAELESMLAQSKFQNGGNSAMKSSATSSIGNSSMSVMRTPTRSRATMTSRAISQGISNLSQISEHGPHDNSVDTLDNSRFSSDVESVLPQDFECTEDEYLTAQRRLSLKRRLDSERTNSLTNTNKIPRTRTPTKPPTGPMSSMTPMQRRALMTSTGPMGRGSIANPKMMMAAASAALNSNTIGSQKRMGSGNTPFNKPISEREKITSTPSTGRRAPSSNLTTKPAR